MDKLTNNQRFHLILADIAMAMAITTLDGGTALCDGEYAPGLIRDTWLAKVTDQLMRQRVTALASAGLGALQSLDGDALVEKARRFGIPLSDDLAAEIGSHFTARREAVMTYRR